MEHKVEISPKMLAVAELLISECEGVDNCIYTLSRNIIVEVGKSEIDRVVSALKTQYEDVAPYSKAVEMLPYLHDFILVGSLISESPLERRDIISTPSIEKLLVDRASEKSLDMTSEQLKRLFQQSFEKYPINSSRLVRYAARRGKKTEVKAIVDGLNYDRINTVHVLQNCLEAFPVEKAWLFGSFSRMEERPDSDIDILIRLRKPVTMGLVEFSNIILSLEAATGKQIDLVVDSTVKEFAKESINKDKVLFYERAVPG